MLSCWKLEVRMSVPGPLLPSPASDDGNGIESQADVSITFVAAEIPLASLVFGRLPLERSTDIYATALASQINLSADGILHQEFPRRVALQASFWPASSS